MRNTNLFLSAKSLCEFAGLVRYLAYLREGTMRAVLCLTLLVLMMTGRAAYADDIVTIASKTPEFSTLVKLVQAAGLVDALKGKGPFTVLAPTNDAFAKLPKEVTDDLLKPENKDKLRKILLYHVVGTKLTSAELSGASVGMRGQSLSGDELTLTSLNPITVNTAKVIKADVLADNGVIHVIDTVLIPGQNNTAQTATGSGNTMSAMASSGLFTPLGTQTITEVAASDPQFSTLVSLLKLTGLDETLSKRGPLTVFAPTNEAFAKLPASTVAELTSPQGRGTLIKILQYHILGGAATAAVVSNLNGQQVRTTLRPATVTVSTTGGVKVNNANVVKADVGASNGVIHVIDTVLIPPTAGNGQTP